MEIIVVLGVLIRVKLFLSYAQAIFDHVLTLVTGQIVTGLQRILASQGSPLTLISHC